MEALHIVPSRILGLKLIENRVFDSFSGVRQVGFTRLLPGKRKDQCFCVRRRSYKDDKNGGKFVGRRSGNAQDKETEEEGVLLGTERDGSGSVVGFHLIPQSGTNLIPQSGKN